MQRTEPARSRRTSPVRPRPNPGRDGQKKQANSLPFLYLVFSLGAFPAKVKRFALDNSIKQIVRAVPALLLKQEPL
ncbi:hypothetical protein F9K75_00390 [Brucella intermedia]|nr:hypothetical protein F9K75_00390 [Brucella intermedia]